MFHMKPKRRFNLRFSRHKCPPDVQITITINGQDVVGPLTGQAMAYIARYGGFHNGYVDLLESYHPAGRIDHVGFHVKYLPARRR